MKNSTHRILLVDDGLDQGFLTHRALTKLTAVGSVHLARSGNEAISYLMGEGEFADRRKFPFPTIVITDLGMNGDGFDILEFLQGNPAWSVVPAIMYSASDDDDDVRTAFALGVSAYHVKPVRATEAEKFAGGDDCLLGSFRSTSGG